jgi:phosphoribosylaminoimidazole carboxylase (NCAIR synthetase)
MVKLNIKKFSRSKVEEEPQTEQVSEQVATITEPETSKKRGRPKKIQSQEIEIIKEVNEDKVVVESDIETADIETVDNEFLSELNNENYLIDDTDSEKQSLNESKSMMKNLLKNKKTKPVKQVKAISKEDDNDSLFGEDATPILGKDKRVLIAKVHQYKNLFPTELKKLVGD